MVQVLCWAFIALFNTTMAVAKGSGRYEEGLPPMLNILFAAVALYVLGRAWERYWRGAADSD